MSGLGQEGRASVRMAAEWLADQPEGLSAPVPELKRRFGLTAQEACASCALAFAWAECEDAVVDALKKYFRVKEIEVERMERNPEWDRPRRDRDDDYGDY